VAAILDFQNGDYFLLKFVYISASNHRVDTITLVYK